MRRAAISASIVAVTLTLLMFSIEAAQTKPSIADILKALKDRANNMLPCTFKLKTDMILETTVVLVNNRKTAAAEMSGSLLDNGREVLKIETVKGDDEAVEKLQNTFDNKPSFRYGCGGWDPLCELDCLSRGKVVRTDTLRGVKAIVASFTAIDGENTGQLTLWVDEKLNPLQYLLKMQVNQGKFNEAIIEKSFKPVHSGIWVPVTRKVELKGSKVPLIDGSATFMGVYSSYAFKNTVGADKAR